MAPRPYRRGGLVPRVAVAVLAGLLASLWVQAHVAGLYRIPTGSMVPTLVAGDLVVADRREAGAVRRGDVAILERAGPDGEPEAFAKRVVALEGQTVAFRGRELVVDGVPVARAFQGEAQLDPDGDPVRRAALFPEGEVWGEAMEGRAWTVLQRRTAPTPPQGPWQVPAGHVFVLGDNRDDSIDSRDPAFGTVPVAAIVGRVRWVAASSKPAGRWRSERTGMPVP